jgi:amidohydrolase
MDLTAVKERMADEVRERGEVLIDASHQIHEHPELNYEEQFAHDLLTQILDDEGLPVERGARGIPTAFEARAGSSGPLIAVLCEYDALPGIGHACGHNIIATAGLGAGLAAAAVAEDVGGRVLILGTPAEEGGGGKVKLHERGALDDVDAAMMVHPAGADLTGMHAIAVAQVWVSYEGECAHAAAFPYKGRNALDAAVLGYMNVAALRQHIRPTERIHGIITHGGDKPNIVPDFARTEWMVRSPSLRSLEPLKERVLACLRAGAEAARCTMTAEWQEPVYADMVHNRVMVELYRANAEALGREVIDPDPALAVVGSTDMGNVSYVVPSIHPMIKVAPPNIPIHTPEFATWARGEDGDSAVIDGAIALAWTVADLWLGDGTIEAARAEFESISGRRSTDAAAG